MSESCENCQFWYPLDMGVVGSCRRFPPKLVVGQADMEQATCVALIPGAWDYPVTDSDDWCGEWRCDGKQDMPVANNNHEPHEAWKANKKWLANKDELAAWDEFSADMRRLIEKELRDNARLERPEGE